MSSIAQAYVIDLPAAAAEAAAWRPHLLARRRQGLPTAARLCLDAPLPEETLRTVCEFLQYTELCITDSRSIACLLTPTPPSDRTARLQKLFSRFALGGIVLTDRHYACLRTPAAQMLFARLRPIPTKFHTAR